MQFLLPFGEVRFSKLSMTAGDSSSAFWMLL
jgi:hypothetical protein